MRPHLSMLPLLLAALCSGADERGELPLSIDGAGVTAIALPALLVGAPGDGGMPAMHQQRDPAGPVWRPLADSNLDELAKQRFALGVPRSVGSTIVVATLPMP